MGLAEVSCGGCLQCLAALRARPASGSPAGSEPEAGSVVLDDRWDHADDSVHRRALAFELASADGGLSVRRMAPRDLDAAADLCVSTFDDLMTSVGLGPEFPPRSLVDVPGFLYSQGTLDKEEAGFLSFVAVDAKGEVVGANRIELQDGVGGIGPLCSRAPGAGRLLMMAAMRAAAERGVRSVRLHGGSGSITRNYSLYLGLGFEPRRAVMQYVGSCSAGPPSGIAVEPLGAADVEECSALHWRVCGTRRAKGIAAAVGGIHPAAVARDGEGRLLGYTTGCHEGGHAVALSEGALRALVVAQSSAIAAALASGASLPPATLFVPHQCSRLARWLASSGFRLYRQVTSMSYGPHPEPRGGIYLPSITY